MRTDHILIIGAGGHAKVVIDALQAGSQSQPRITLVDDDARLHGKQIMGISVVQALPDFLSPHTFFHVAIGGNRVREAKFLFLQGRGIAASVVHPRAVVSLSSSIQNGAFVAAGAIVGPECQVAEGCIINHGAVVDHDCLVDAFSHIAPNATLAGNVRIGRRVLVGAGANVLPGVSIGDDCIVGAGAVVLNDLKSGSVHMGVPARKFK